MEGTWPLILDGVECGSVTAERRGAYTVFTARALYTGGVKRISLYGGGAEGYLGVLAPDGDGVSLTRKLTRSAAGLFPGAAGVRRRGRRLCRGRAGAGRTDGDRQMSRRGSRRRLPSGRRRALVRLAGRDALAL